mmetsp:Transcript_27197/g.28264  ORF Transcript_27197/g.28264 Transcript_27197/m.28264 type:complete len:343 (+) Transcript_27197:18-1046(+)
MEKKNTFKALTVNEFGGKIEVKEHPLRELQKDEYLVKVMGTTILPADLFFVAGQYGTHIPDLPLVPGFEGSGIIEAVGEGVDKSVIGKRCSILADQFAKEFRGTWAQYHITNSQLITIFNDDVPYDRIICSNVNPLTAVGFLDTLKKMGKKSVAHNGASSAFGRMFLRLCISQGIEVINIVRKESSIKEMKEFGGKHFVNTSQEGWENELKKKCLELDVTVLFECVGGKTTGKSLSALPSGSTLFHFGNLELAGISEVNTGDLIFQKKKIEGWWLLTWITSIKPEEALYWKKLIIDDFEKNDGKIFGTAFNKAFALEDYEKALGVYKEQSTKVVFKPWGIDA